MTPASPPPTAPAPPPGPARTLWALGLVAAGIAIIAGLVWLAGRAPAPVVAPVDPVNAIAVKMVSALNQDLPKDYGDGLVLERIDVEGRRIVMIMRSQGMTLAAAARDPDRYNAVREVERTRLLGFCGMPEFRMVLDEGVVITRRFIDRDGARFFDISVAAGDCPPRT